MGTGQPGHQAPRVTLLSPGREPVPLCITGQSSGEGEGRPGVRASPAGKLLALLCPGRLKAGQRWPEGGTVLCTGCGVIFFQATGDPSLSFPSCGPDSVGAWLAVARSAQLWCVGDMPCPFAARSPAWPGPSLTAAVSGDQTLS